MARSRRGQAELIAATIAISVFVLAVAFMILSVTATGYVSTSALAERARFENERQLEKLAYIYDPNFDTCSITNAGAVEIKIVRVWKPDGTVDASSSIVNEVINPGKQLSICNWNDVAYIVTARGNVFPIQSRCQELKELSSIPQSGGANGGSGGAPPYTSSNFITSEVYYIGSDSTKQFGILCNISVLSESGRIINYDRCFMLYNKSGTWYINNGADWRTISNDRLSYIYKGTSDLDNNGINEYIIVYDVGNQRYSEYELKKQYNYRINITFLDAIEITESTDVIEVYYKFVIVLSSSIINFGDVISTISIALCSPNSCIVFPSQYTTYTSDPGRYIIALQGSVTIPRQAYQGLLQRISSGRYNLSLLMYIDNAFLGSAFRYVRLEMLAVSGANIPK